MIFQNQHIKVENKVNNKVYNNLTINCLALGSFSLFQAVNFFTIPHLKIKYHQNEIFGERRINSGYILTCIVVCGRIYSVL